MSEERISIDPITRLEGHGKIDILLDDDGDVQDAVLQVPELRGFERFCQGRRAETMPRITERICGVCPEAHHFASTKALDSAFQATPPEGAQKLRELLYNAYIFADHTLHLYYLGGPDYLTPESTPKEARNIVGVLDEVGLDIGQEVIKHRRLGHQIIEIIGGHQVHPVTGIPGGLSKGINEEEREEILEAANSCRKFALQSLDLLREHIIDTPRFEELLTGEGHSLKTYYMGLVDDQNGLSFYDGDLRVVSPEGEEFARVSTDRIMELVDEHVEPWTFVKFPYLKEIGWKGFVGGADSGLFRVGPLARINVAEGMKTEQAQKEYEKFMNRFGSPVVHQTYGYIWARLIELVQSAERMKELAEEESLVEGDLKSELGEPGEGIGVIEAARGTLIHHYNLDSDGLVEGANMIVPSTSNNAALSMSIRQAAEEYLDGSEVDDRLLNKVEMAFRPYDPCLACASHAVDGGLDIEVNIYDSEGQLQERLRKDED